MQDKQFITEPKRGSLSIGQHRLLMSWAYDCTWHVLSSFGKNIDERLLHALEMTTAWKAGKAKVGEDREAWIRNPVLKVRRIKNRSCNNYQEII